MSVPGLAVGDAVARHTRPGGLLTNAKNCGTPRPWPPRGTSAPALVGSSRTCLGPLRMFRPCAMGSWIGSMTPPPTLKRQQDSPMPCSREQQIGDALAVWDGPTSDLLDSSSRRTRRSSRSPGKRLRADHVLMAADGQRDQEDKGDGVIAPGARRNCRSTPFATAAEAARPCDTSSCASPCGLPLMRTVMRSPAKRRPIFCHRAAETVTLPVLSVSDRRSISSYRPDRD